MKIKNSPVNEKVTNLFLSKPTLNSQSPRHTKYKPNSVLIIGKIKILISIPFPPLYKALLKTSSPFVQGFTYINLFNSILKKPSSSTNLLR